MINGYTVFFSYMLESDPDYTSGFGYSSGIHCNYINSLHLDSITNKEVNIYFNDINDFKFINVSGGTGYTVHNIYLLVQLIDNSTYENVEDIKPNSSEWRKYDVTEQIENYVTGQTLSAYNLTSSIFKVPIYLYYNETLMPKYTLDYLNYPKVTQSGTTQPLSFGEEQYFFGNVSTEIEAIAYTTDLSINLLTNEYNSTDNETWDGDKVYITEIALYDDNKNIVAIAKLNNPILKDSTIARTIVFGMDF